MHHEKKQPPLLLSAVSPSTSCKHHSCVKEEEGEGEGGKTHGAVAFLLSSLETPPPAIQKQTGRITSFLAAGLMDRRGRQRRRSSPQNNRFSSSHGFTSQTMETSVNWAFLYSLDKSRECHLMGVGISSRKGKSKDFVTVKHNNHSAFLVDMTSCSAGKHR